MHWLEDREGNKIIGESQYCHFSLWTSMFFADPRANVWVVQSATPVVHCTQLLSFSTMQMHPNQRLQQLCAGQFNCGA